jgi:hypothetical protein
MTDGEANELAKKLADAIKSAGFGEAQVVQVKKGSADFEKAVHDLADEMPDEFYNKPCDSALHEAISISVMYGFPPGSDAKQRTWPRARKLPHTMDSITIGASLSVPEFWYFLGKGLGWKEDDGIGVPEYMQHWHEYVNMLGRVCNPTGKQESRVKDIDAFFEKFVRPFLDKQKAEQEAKGS